MTDTIIILLIQLASFIIGVKIGQKSAKKEDLQLNPIRFIKEELKQKEINKKEKLEKEKLDTIFYNIDNYTGNGIGQKQIPK